MAIPNEMVLLLVVVVAVAIVVVVAVVVVSLNMEAQISSSHPERIFLSTVTSQRPK